MLKQLSSVQIVQEMSSERAGKETFSECSKQLAFLKCMLLFGVCLLPTKFEWTYSASVQNTDKIEKFPSSDNLVE